MKRILFFVLLFISVAAQSQLMQTNNTAGGYQWVGFKSDSLHIIPRGSDTPAIGGTKFGKSTVGAMFYKTTDSTLWIRSSNKWNQVTGTGGGGDGINSLGQGFGVTIVNDSTYNVDSLVFLTIENFYNKIDSFNAALEAGTIDSIIGTSPIAIDFANRRVPVISYTGDTTRVFIFENPLTATVYGDTILVQFDTTLHNTTPFLDGRYYPITDNPAGYLTYDSASGLYMDTAYVRSDSIIGAKNGTEFLIATIPNLSQDGLISPGLVYWIDSLKFGVTAANYRINQTVYNSPHDSVTLSPADPTDPRIDVIGVNTSSSVFVEEGTAAADPITPQVDPATELGLTDITINAGDTIPAGIIRTTFYDLNAGTPTEASWAFGAGLTGSFSNTTNPYHLTHAIDVNSWINSGTRTITGTWITTLNRNDYTLVQMFIDLKATLASTANIQIRFYNGTTAVTGAYTITAANGFTKTDVGYQAITIPLSALAFSNNTFDKIQIIVTGAGGGMYIDWVQLQGGFNPGSGTSGTVTNFTYTNTYALTGVVTNSTTIPNLTVTLDTSLTGTKEWFYDRIDSLVATLGGGGTVTSFSSGDLSPLFTTSVATATTTPALSFSLSNATAWQIFRRGSGTGAPSYGGLLAEHLNTTYSNGNMLITDGSGNLSWTTAGTALNGTGYVKMSGTTPSYQSNTQLTADINTFTQTLSGAVPAPTTLNNYVLRDDGTWVAQSAGLSNPMTTTGDMIYSSDNSGTPARLGIGTTGQVLEVVGGLPTWSVSIPYLRYIPASKSGVSTDGGNAGTGTNGGTDANAYNLFLGANSGYKITSGINNLAIGLNTLDSITTSEGNLAIGGNTLSKMTTPVSGVNSGHLAIGYEAMFNTTNPSGASVAIGRRALYTNTTGQLNTAIGLRSLESNSTGNFNIAIGATAANSATGSNNIDIGYQAAVSRTLGGNNTVIGHQAMANVTTGDVNNSTFIGSGAGTGVAITSAGDNNTAVGTGALTAFTSGAGNTVLGVSAGNSITSGNRNIVINTIAVTGGVTTGGSNTVIGDNQNVPIATQSNQMVLGYAHFMNHLYRHIFNGGPGSNGQASGYTFNNPIAFDFRSTDGGIKLPTVTVAQRNAIGSPQANIIVTGSDLDINNDYNGTVWTVEDGVIFTQTADKNINTTAAETTLFGTGSGTLTIPANYLYSGNTILIKVQGYMTTNGAPTLDIKFKLGSTTITSTGATTLVAVGSNGYFEAEFILTARASPGASAAVMGQGKFTYFSAATTPNLISAMSTATVATATNGSLAVDVTATFGTSDANNKIVSTNAWVEIKN